MLKTFGSMRNLSYDRAKNIKNATSVSRRFMSPLVPLANNDNFDVLQED